MPPVSGDIGATFAKVQLAEAYETLALIHSKASRKPAPAAKKPAAATAPAAAVKRDPNEPKKPSSAYTLFTHEKRLEIKNKQPDIPANEAWTKTIEAWSSISSEERQQYEDRAVVLKKEYLAAMAKYKAEHGGSTPVAEPKDDNVNDKDEEEVEDLTPAAPALAPAPSKAPRAKKTKDADVPVPAPASSPAPAPIVDDKEGKAEEGVIAAAVPSKAHRVKKPKDTNAPTADTTSDGTEPKAPAEPAVAASNGSAPEKRKKKSASAGEVAVASTSEHDGEHHDYEKKKKKKKSHKSKHSESQ
ncbi:TOX high mobility group box member 4 [Coemansia aciculifera]|uniref:TOX high mobility group box member 4 n=1 Tax=Coemansia aciculifera TaxID=417176 RepID=A0ACC1M5Z7_9FUNG|nr:TOX high mobility group box member 4 [Coemansia aciculifera]